MRLAVRAGLLAVACCLAVVLVAGGMRRQNGASPPVARGPEVPVLVNHAGLYVYSLHGRMRPLHLPFADVQHAAPSPDGRSLAFSAGDCAVCPHAIYVLVGGHIRRLSAGTDPVWSRTGDLVFMRADADGDPSIYRIAPTGRDLQPLLSPQRPDAGSGSWSPAPSPDGRQILFVKEVSERFQIAILTLDGHRVRVLTGGDNSVTMPAWSPDGKQIAFSALDPTGASLYVMDADGRHVRRLVGGGALAPAWSPDGHTIAFTDSHGNPHGFHSLYAVDVRTGKVRVLAGGNGDYTAPVWAPSGKELYVDWRPSTRVPSS